MRNSELATPEKRVNALKPKQNLNMPDLWSLGYRTVGNTGVGPDEVVQVEEEEVEVGDPPFRSRLRH